MKICFTGRVVQSDEYQIPPGDIKVHKDYYLFEILTQM